MRRCCSIFVACLCFLGGAGIDVDAHDIPADVLIQAWLKPEGQRLDLLLRMPLSTMRDINFPMHNGTMLTLPVPEAMLQTGAELWIAKNFGVFENGAPLRAPRIRAVRLSLPSDQSFASWASAQAHFSAPPVDPTTEIAWNQMLLDVALEFDIASNQSRFAIEPAFARLGLRVVTTLRYVTPDGSVRAFEYPGDPGVVYLDPRWHQAALQFVGHGFDHILSGLDHLLFLACLVLPFRRLRPLVLIVTSFTVAHSITLIASAFNFAPDALWFPPLIETLIAASIVYMALENIVISSRTRLTGARAPEPIESMAVRHRWIITFAFGLVHGFGFSFALRETLQFAGSHMLTSLLAFNVGVELGQLLVLILLIPLLSLVFRYVVAERIGIIIASAFVAHTAWHWLSERFTLLLQYNGPQLGLGDWVTVLRAAMAMVALAGIWWLVRARRSA